MSRFISLSAAFMLVFGLVQLAHAESREGPNSREFYCTYYQLASFLPGEKNLQWRDIDAKLCNRLIVIDYSVAVNDDTMELYFTNTTYKNDLLNGARKFKQRNSHARLFLEADIYLNAKFINKIIDKGVSFSKFAKNLAKFVSNTRVFDGFIIRTAFNINVDSKVLDEFFKALRDALHAKRLALYGNNSPFDDTLAVIFPYLDRIIMNDQDISLSSDKIFHITSLYRRQDATGMEFMFNKDFQLDYMLFLGAPREKLLYLLNVVGLSFELTDSRLTSIGAPRKPTGSNGNTYWSMPEICGYLKMPSWSYKFDEELAAPYAYNSTHWVSFDNFKSYGYKMDVVRKKDLRGVVIDSIDSDDIHGKACDSGKFPFAKFIKKHL